MNVSLVPNSANVYGNVMAQCLYCIHLVNPHVLFVIISLICVVLFALSNIGLCVIYFVSGSDSPGSDYDKSAQGRGHYLTHRV